jgi:hypothetical protein
MPLLRHANEALGDEVFEVTRENISDVLLSALVPVPPGYNLHPRTRHDRRRNKALLRDWRLGIAPLGSLNA